MSNWFEDHPAWSIILHTILIATVMWAISSFLLDENKINLYKAQTENCKAVSEQYKVKVELLEKDNQKFLRWLENKPDTIPFLELKIKNLESENEQLKGKLASIEKVAEPNIAKQQEDYFYTKDLSKGEAFVDLRTGATIGVSDIGSNYEAKGIISLPGRKAEDIDGVKPGKSWDFEKSDIKYKLTVTKVNWLNNSFQVQVKEISEQQKSNFPKSGNFSGGGAKGEY